EHPMPCVNCAAIPQELIESVLFGHERGAFTGAHQQRRGIFEEAHKGTVLLDEVGELSPAAQAALLRVLETKRITRVGSVAEIEVDVRILAATHRNLEAMCESGRFRWDLLYRLNTMTLKLPTLSERPEEIEAMATRFMEEANVANGREIREIAPEALKALKSHSWPGNVRELRNVMHRAVVMAEGETIGSDAFPDTLHLKSNAPAGRSGDRDAMDDESDPALDYKERIQRYETRLIRAALERKGWVQTEAAQLLGIPVRTLAHKMRAFGVAKP
ncbi:MAG: sigma-54-dependent Fis family transcriptional regulator, partial [Deltaproteobacteria bacterium]|nr:sigma-54-dependent Fis family transcriptional regulator [Deltaproteobacteria bacterium]